MPRLKKKLLGILFWLAGVVSVFAEPLSEPYLADEFTLHLWHLDEAAPPFADNGSAPCPLLGLENNARAGHASAPGLGSSIYFNTSAGGKPGTYLYRGGILMAKPRPANGRAANVDAPFPIMGENGAFTFEATVKLDCLPDKSPGRASDIIVMDEEGPGRVFIFRIDKPNFLSFLPLADGAVKGGALASLPTTGPDAVNTNDWFHVAVTYDGRAGASDNLKLYWTRLAPGLDSAHLIGSGSLAEPLSDALGKFAIGNNGRTVTGHNENGPFPGLIDEVRISSIARAPFDFYFVTPEIKARARAALPAATDTAPLELLLHRVLVDNAPVALEKNLPQLNLSPGQHRLDIDFGISPAAVSANPLAVRWRLEGIDDQWQTADTGMEMTVEALDAMSNVVSRAVFPVSGASADWEMDLIDSRYSPRWQPFFLPGNSCGLRVTLSAGTPDITGRFAISDFSVTLPDAAHKKVSVWRNGNFSEGEIMDAVSGVPANWQRSGSEPAIAQVIQKSPPSHPLGLVDADRTKTAAWTSVQPLPELPPGGVTATLRWSEAYNIIGGSSHQVTYVNIPPGKYIFRAIVATDATQPASAQLALPVVIRPPLMEQPWFLAASASTFVALAALVLIQNQRRRAAARLARSRLQHALERDRARIARDLHDDLGTRISALSMNAAFVGRDLDKDPAKARERIPKLEASGRELIVAMNSLVWAVNPANDTLDHLAGHLASLAEELFRDSPARLRLSIPAELPPLPMRSEFRHHFALAVKEALNNAFKHADAREVNLDLHLKNNELVASVTDDGVGFDPANPSEGNGLRNIASRLAEIGGTCSIVSIPNKGTQVFLCCPAPSNPK